MTRERPGGVPESVIAQSFLDGVRRLLIVMPSWVGDTVMATPLLAALNSAPQRVQEGMSLTGYMRAGLDELLDGGRLLDDMICGRPAGAFGPWRVGRELARRDFDAAILLPNSARIGLTACFSRIPRRLGYGRDARSILLTHPVPCPFDEGWKARESTVRYYLALGEAMTLEVLDHRLRLASTTDQEAGAAALLRSADVSPDEPYAVLNPGANRHDKRWPAPRFSDVADHLTRTHGLRILVSGSPGERELVDDVCRRCAASVVNLTEHRPSLGLLKPLLQRAKLLVTNDTGPRHIAVGVAFAMKRGPGVVTLFGPTDPRYAEINYAREIQLSTDGRPIEEIALQEVTEACDRLLTDPTIED